MARYVVRGGHVLDPFAGSGTTLVQALESGYDATGIDVAGFNALLMRVKTAQYDIRALAADAEELAAGLDPADPAGRAPSDASDYVRAWFAPTAAKELLAAIALARRLPHREALEVVVARAARSARLTTHFDLDFPRAPQTEPYWCHKHRRTCRPVEGAHRFLTRYLADSVARIEEFDAVRDRDRRAVVVHGDARQVELGGRYDGVVTSPPYPGLIDYHEQHRYAYELLGLADRRAREVGAAARGTSRLALEEYVDAISAVLARVGASLASGAPVCIVVNDRRDLYPTILRRAGLRLEERLERHVNRRTGRRAGEYFESILVATAT